VGRTAAADAGRGGVSEATLARELAIRGRLRALGYIVLGGGLLAAVLLFFHPTPNREKHPIGFEEMGGRLIPIYPESSKRYQQAAQATLGGGGMLLSDIREGFIDLWHGRRLAYTLAFLSVAVSYGLFYFADLFGYPATVNQPPAGPPGDAPRPPGHE
jgi:hypothetical protein